MSDNPLEHSKQACIDSLHIVPGRGRKERTTSVKYIRRFAQHVQVVTSTWSRVLVLIWKTNPWYVTWLLVFTFLGGLIPSLQIQITSQIIQNAAEAIQGGQAPQLVHLAIVFGVLQGGLMLVSSVLGIGQQQLQSLLQTKLANAIAIQIMEKAIELDVQYFEDDEFYDKLQRANRESSYRPYQIFWQSASSIRTICSSATCSNFSMSLLIAFVLDLFGFGV